MQKSIRHFGLIGSALGHSFSRRYFEEKFLREGIADCQYSLHEMPSDLSRQQLLDWVYENHVEGFNVTFPFKVRVAQWVDRSSPEAIAVGAVNCVRVLWRDDNHFSLYGTNTDCLGFLQTVRSLSISPREALILGTGGAAMAVAVALKQLQYRVHFVSRNPSRFESQSLLGFPVLSYEDLSLSNCSLIVNATPVGTFPNVEESPLAQWQELSPQQVCYDLVYNPSTTLFLEQAKCQGARIVNGLAMLYAQAELSWNFWNEQNQTSL